MQVAIALLAGVGAVSLLFILGRLFSLLKQYVLASFPYKSYNGKWAVITGASSGIGAGFVRSLAARGLNVVLLARSQDKMETLAKEVSDKYRIKTEVISFDFSNADKSAYEKLGDRLKALSPSVLVNNVGVNVEMPTEFMDMDTEDVDRIVRVNITSINRMTRMLLPEMISTGQGIVINMSSGGGVVAPAPLLAVYGGTKAYADAFAVALSGEVKEKGVAVASMTPFFVESAMAKMRRSFTVPSADAFAEKALKQMGASPRLSPYWVHEIMGTVLNLLPLGSQVDRIAALHKTIRKKAIRKKERLAKQS